MRLPHPLLSSLAITALILGACTPVAIPQPKHAAGAHQTLFPADAPANPLNISGKNLPGYVNPYPVGTHAHFAAKPKYPKTMEYWFDKKLMEQLTASNSKLIICLPQQRARVYVNDTIAMDWAVSTGVNGRLTPTVITSVLEKKERHASNRYGRLVDAEGKTINSDADSSHGVPEGATFRGAGMPHWHRFTWDGVGLHGGRVVPGRRLSHGCVRSPYHVVRLFFSYSQVNMPVYITRAVEDYARGGFVKAIDAKYRPIPNNDYTDMPPSHYGPDGKPQPQMAAPSSL